MIHCRKYSNNLYRRFHKNNLLKIFNFWFFSHPWCSRISFLITYILEFTYRTKSVSSSCNSFLLNRAHSALGYSTNIISHQKHTSYQMTHGSDQTKAPESSLFFLNFLADASDLGWISYASPLLWLSPTSAESKWMDGWLARPAHSRQKMNVSLTLLMSIKKIVYWFSSGE